MMNSLDNRRLEGLRPKLRDLQPYLAGLGLQLALIVARARVPTRLAALVALRIAQSVRFGLKQRVQRLLHPPSYDPVEVALDPLVVNRDDIVQRTRCSLGHGGSFSLTWSRLPTSSSARFGAASPTPLCGTICTSSQRPPHPKPAPPEQLGRGNAISASPHRNPHAP